MKVLKIAILGIPNSGKSTFVNRLIDYKASIVSPKPHTTRDVILAMCTQKDKQIIFIDTPGISSSNKSTEKKLANIAENNAKSADLYLFLVDGKKKIQPHLIQLFQKITKPKIAVINKIDQVNTSKLLPITADLQPFFEKIFSVSALYGYGVDDLLEYLMKQCANMPENNEFYDAGMKTTRSNEQLIIDQTKEVIFHLMDEEIPYQVDVNISSFEENAKGEWIIHQNIFVKKSYRAIFLGMIKELSMSAKRNMENLFKKKIHLFINIMIEK